MNDSVMSQRIKDLYAAFNRRDGSFVIDQMSPDVSWPRAFEGDSVKGQDAVRAYWEDQWRTIDPIVEPTSIELMDDGRYDVEIHQVVKDLDGNLLFEGIVHHFYAFDDELISSMEVNVAKTDLGLD